jgi:hypothetical protein
MTILEYLQKLDDICKREFISVTELVRELDIAHNTFMRIKRSPEKCAMKTMRKIKAFVDKWEAKNMSAIH